MKTKTQPQCLTAALDYLARGWSALALCPPDHSGVYEAHKDHCGAPGKAPLWPWKEFGQKGATTFRRPVWKRLVTAAMPRRMSLMPLRTHRPDARNSSVSVRPAGSPNQRTERGKAAAC